jgi:hypothetical protein
MTADQKLDLLEMRPLQRARHQIPSGRMRFVIESAEAKPLARLERWAARMLKNRIDQAEAEAELRRYIGAD